MMQGVAVLGANGRMGGSLIRLLAGSQTQRLVAAVTEPGHACIGEDAGTVAGLPAAGVRMTDQPADAASLADVVIDFTSPAAFPANLAACVAAGRPVVIGTTGLAEAQQRQLAEAGRRIAIVYGRNMSLGVAVIGELVRLAAGLLGPEYDIEITEAHHRHKRDAPSGTALELGEAAAAGRGLPMAQLAVAGRHGADCRRQPGEIGFAALRAGGIIGEHRVLFGSDEELVEVRHEALDRALFARGALRAGQWLAGRPPGVYAMRDVLGLGRVS